MSDWCSTRFKAPQSIQVPCTLCFGDTIHTLSVMCACTSLIMSPTKRRLLRRLFFIFSQLDPYSIVFSASSINLIIYRDGSSSGCIREYAFLESFTSLDFRSWSKSRSCSPSRPNKKVRNIFLMFFRKESWSFLRKTISTESLVGTNPLHWLSFKSLSTKLISWTCI